MKFKSAVALSIATALISSGVAVPALANSTPNPYTPTGASWIDVPQADRVYFEDFDEGTQDDTNVFYAPSGVSCTINGVTATGPFVFGDDNTEPDATTCTQNGSPFDPVDTANRVGAHPIGFTVNFFGTNYTSLYFSENGGIFFDNPSTRYDQSLTHLSVNARTSLIAPLALDMFYDEDEGSIWTAQTTIGGKQAFVISWQEMDECCESNTPDGQSASFQFVFINEGSGNFTAYFNYDKFVDVDQGYNPAVFVDMKNGVTVGSNIVRVDTVAGLTAGTCQQVSDDTVGSGTLDDAGWDSNANYIKLESSVNKTVSVWSDSNCTAANNISVIQDITNGPVYIELEFSGVTFNSVAIGWGTYNQSTGATNVTELFANEDIANFYDGGSKQLKSYSLNTTVTGRIVLGQVAGVTTGDPTNPNSAPIGPAAPEIRDVPYYGPVGLKVQPTALANDYATATGNNLATITTVTVGQTLTTFEIRPNGTLVFVVPNLAKGRYQVTFFVAVNNVYLTATLDVLGTKAVGSTESKVNVGSFSGKLVVYAYNLTGKTIAWKVGGKWGKGLATSNYSVFDRPTPRSGATVNVEVFVNGVSSLTKTVTTR